MAAMEPVQDPLGLDLQELEAVALKLGIARFRAVQIFAALHRQRVRTWNEVTTLPAAERERLAERLPLTHLSICERIPSRDGTVRYLLALADGERVEAVYLPDEVFDGAGGKLRRRATFCISTQVGCPVNCQFCLTAQLGLRRSLTAGEIVGEVMTLLREHGLSRSPGPADRLNLVYMGMGEPFLNYEAVMGSVRILTDEHGVGLPPRRITISTSGIVDKIRRFSAERVRPRLAISLNATTDADRQRLMPLNRAQGGLAALFAAAREFRLAPRERLTFEYVLLGGINDGTQDVERLVELTRGIRCKINLIAWNPGPELALQAPAAERVRAFQAGLAGAGIPTYVRRPRGQDVYAACGQLSRRPAAPLMA